MKTLARPQKIILTTLIMAFLLFNVGLPVSMYLCPMMSPDLACCTLSSSKVDPTLSLTRQAMGCCTPVLIAERSTIPFIKSQELHFFGYKIDFTYTLPKNIVTQAYSCCPSTSASGSSTLASLRFSYLVDSVLLI
jgi:hypothetical protein